MKHPPAKLDRFHDLYTELRHLESWGTGRDSLSRPSSLRTNLNNISANCSNAWRRNFSILLTVLSAVKKKIYRNILERLQFSTNCSSFKVLLMKIDERENLTTIPIIRICLRRNNIRLNTDLTLRKYRIPRRFVIEKG